MVFADARVWKYLISSVSKIIKESTLRITEEGIGIRAMDDSKVALVDLFFPKKMFSEYEVEEETSFGINVEELAKVLRRGTKDDMLAIEVKESRYGIEFVGRGKRKFWLPQIEVPMQETLDPNTLQLKAKVEIFADAYREMVKDVEPVADLVTIIISPSGLTLDASSDLGRAVIEAKEETGVLLNIEAENAEKSSYSVEYLIYMTSASQAVDKVALELGTDMPLRMRFYLGEDPVLTYVVAPRTEE